MPNADDLEPLHSELAALDQYLRSTQARRVAFAANAFVARVAVLVPKLNARDLAALSVEFARARRAWLAKRQR